jgi:hypothetical protein
MKKPFDTLKTSTFLVTTAFMLVPQVAWAAKIIGNG